MREFSIRLIQNNMLLFYLDYKSRHLINLLNKDREIERLSNQKVVF